MSIKAVPAWNMNDMPATSLRAQREHDLETRGLNAENWNARKTLDVAFKELVDSVQSDDSKMSVLMSILQSKHDAMMQIAKNMSLTREERKVLEERRERIEKLRRLAEDRKLEEDEALELLELLLSDEDRDLLEQQLSEQLAFA